MPLILQKSSCGHFGHGHFGQTRFRKAKSATIYNKIFFIIIVSRKRHPIFNLTNLTLTNLTTLKKFFEKSCSKIRRAHFQCRIFAPDLKVKAPSDCRQTVVRGSENEGRSKREDVRRQMADGE